MAADEPMALRDLFDRKTAGLSRPGLHHNLKQLVEAGLVERLGERRQARYIPIERVEVDWTARLGGRWRRMNWSCTPPFDWRYPLVGRIPSSKARRPLLTFLDGIELRLLHRPDRLMEEQGRLREAVEELYGSVHHADRDEFVEHLSSRESYGAFTVAVFGSCARGDDRAGSDVDVLVQVPDQVRYPEGGRLHDQVGQAMEWLHEDIVDRLRDLAADIELSGEATIDLHVQAGRKHQVPSPIVSAVRREGVTVFTTDRGAMVESGVDDGA